MRDIDSELLDRYLAGQATAREREALEQWLAEDPDRAAWLQALGGALASLEDEVTEGELTRLWRSVAERSGLAETESVTRVEQATAGFELGQARRSGLRLGLGVAAAAALAVGAALAGRQLLTEGGGENGEVTAERVVTVPRGQRAKLRLPDGTDVVLGAGSTLRHPRAFPTGSREVTLEGEAYFTVAHEERRPFRVLAGDLVATQLGTEFLVRAYPENGGARVVVRSGSVAVRAAGTPDSARPGTVVRPGEMARLSRDGVPQVEPADTAAYFAWIAGTLVFDGTPLREALPQLSRWYNLDFRLADSSLGAIPLSGRLDQTLTPARLDLLAASVGLKHERRGREVTFSRPPPAR